MPIGWKPDGSININFILSKPENDRTPLEREIVKVSSCGDSVLLEPQDLASTSPCLKQMSRSGFKSTFEEYRRDVIVFLLKKSAPQLTTKINDEQVLVELANIVTKSTKSVRNIVPMIKGLEKVLLPKVGAYNKKAWMLLGVAWLTIYNLRELNSERVSNNLSGISMSPDLMDSFTGDVLKNLENDKLLINVSQKRRWGCSYEPRYSMIMIGKSYLETLTKLKPQKKYFLENALVHEAFHAWSDLRGGGLSLVDEEVAAHYFGLKASIAAGNLEGEKIEYMKEPSTTFFMEIVKQLRDQELEKLGAIFSREFSGLMDKRFYGVNVLDAINYDHFLYESAVKELKNGRIDSKAREGFKRRYVVYRAISIIYENYARVVFEYRREGRTLEESKQNLERLKSPKALTPFALKNKNLDKKALRESVLDYFHKAIMQTIDVYVVYGEEESRTFIRNELFPNILTDLFLNSCMKMSTK